MLDREVVVDSAEDVCRGREEAGFEGLLRGKLGQAQEFPGAGAGMAGVEQHLQGAPLGQAGEDLTQLVVHDIGAVPVHVVGAEDLVQLVLQLVPVPVPDLGPVPGEMEQQPVPGLGPLDQPLQPLHDGLLGGPLIGNHPDVVYLEPEKLDQAVPHIGHIIDAAAQIRVGHLVLVDPHQQQRD